jgi:undecaprenyl-diphosphatase
MLRIEPNPEPTFVPGSAPAGRGWLSLRAARNVWRAFAGDFAALPTIARRRWLATLVIGFVASATLVAGMTKWGRSHLAEGTPLAERDALLLRWMADHGPISFSNAILLESFGNLAYLVPLTVLCFALAARRRRPLLASAFVVTYVLQRPIVLLGWWMWNRPRPELIAAGIAAPGLHSFPSGHAALTFSAYGLLAWLWMRSTRNGAERAMAVVLFLLLVAVVGWSRVVLSTHWPSDILAGWVAGLAWVLSVIVAQIRAEHAGGR